MYFKRLLAYPHSGCPFWLRAGACAGLPSTAQRSAIAIDPARPHLEDQIKVGLF